MRSVKKLLVATVTRISLDRRRRRSPRIRHPRSRTQGGARASTRDGHPTTGCATRSGDPSQVNLVNLFVTVRDKSKRIVTDLKQTDFKMQEDGQDQQIAFFSKEVTLPITLALLLDTSGSEQFMLGAIQDMGGRFLDRVLRKGDEALVMSFDTDVDLLADFTDDRGLLDRAIRKTRINAPMGGGMINPGPVPAGTYDRHRVLRRGLSGLQRKTQYRSRTQSHRRRHRRARRRQQSPQGRSDRSRPAHGHRDSHLAGRRSALRRQLRRRQDRSPTKPAAA